jgi:hypothetical protein
MAKKSKKTAARYSELSKAKKRKKEPDSSSSPVPSLAASVAAPREASRTQPAERPTRRPVQRPQAESKRGVPSYDHLRGDLRKLGLLGAGMILVLIIVSFVLG